ncbi:hypothetical protein SAMN05443637_122129 [Pseudonocardia thermophila]|uniref:Uncharacterized protein n=1 Tax=Pseudonocardia thermophila TaxID=1848 RepID=A0A1M6Z7C5_PSETH|nr:hypothetical protein [Pseudonocardia thermophila]SHL26325.1 hypothetical protein SAMN05443637_122129 [Pseudonocardia thermophila]
MHDREKTPTLVALDPPTLPAGDLLPPADPPLLDPPPFPEPRRSTGGRLARLCSRLRRRR